LSLFDVVIDDARLMMSSPVVVVAAAVVVVKMSYVFATFKKTGSYHESGVLTNLCGLPKNVVADSNQIKTAATTVIATATTSFLLS